MEFIETALQNLSVESIIFVFVLMLAATQAWKVGTNFLATFGIKFEWLEKRKKESNLLKKHDEMLNEIVVETKATSDKVSVLGQMIVDMQQKTDASEWAKLKDRISQAYRFYHDRGEWNKMEREAFNDLISDYEAHGGQNSFVHSICEPESQTWNVIDE